MRSKQKTRDNERYIAIYARQSVDREQSVSIETQIEFCKREVLDEPFKIYTDKGYSGKNTNRPGFIQMCEDIRNMKIKKVVVYRLDRISRSVLDFSEMIQEFQKYKVDFSSTMEKFDTNSPIGNAMLMIIMVFAQLERETIQQRVIDAYASRSKKGFFMGGPAPFGFRLDTKEIDGVKIRCFVEDPKESTVIRQIFQLYSNPNTSLNDVAKQLASNHVKSRRGADFTSARCRDVILNTVYARCNLEIYSFLLSQNVEVINDRSEFIGTNGGYLYSANGTGKRSSSMAGQMFVLAPHEGLIDADTWIRCRTKCLNNRAVAKPVKAKRTWLAGKVKCGYCGYALTVSIYHTKTHDNKYLVCTHKYVAHTCPFSSVQLDIVEQAVYVHMKRKIGSLSSVMSTNDQEDFRIQELYAEIAELDQELNAWLAQVPHANAALIARINEKTDELTAKKEILTGQIQKLRSDATGPVRSKPEEYLDEWNLLSVDDKISVAAFIIDKVRVKPGQIHVDWRF